MDLKASLMVTLVCLSTTFAWCPDKCRCIKDRVGSDGEHYLIIRCSKLHQIPLEAITSDLTIFMLSYNNIAVLLNIDRQVKDIPTLKVLDLSFNNMTNLQENSLRVFSSLILLNLSNNKIANIPKELFQTLPNLHNLVLSNNPYLRLPENGFGTKAVRSLYIDGCNLDTIPLKFFDSMPKLKLLNLRGNHISYLGPHLITAFQKMDRVYLDHNKLTVFQPELTSLRKTHTTSIYLEGNPFRCDCQFKDGLQQILNMTCVVPPGSNNNNNKVDQEEYLNSLSCDV